MMNFANLKAHEDLKQAATVLVHVRQGLKKQDMWMKMAKAGQKHFTYRDLVLAMHEAWTQALDSPLALNMMHPNMQVSKNLAWYQVIDAAPFYPKEFLQNMKGTERALQMSTDTSNSY